MVICQKFVCLFWMSLRQAASGVCSHSCKSAVWKQQSCTSLWSTVWHRPTAPKQKVTFGFVSSTWCLLLYCFTLLIYCELLTLLLAWFFLIFFYQCLCDFFLLQLLDSFERRVEIAVGYSIGSDAQITATDCHMDAWKLYNTIDVSLFFFHSRRFLF